MSTESSSNKFNANGSDNDDSDDNQAPKIPYRRDRTPSIVVQSLGLSFHKNSNITESIELPGDEEDISQENSNSSETTDLRSSTSGMDEPQNVGQFINDGSSGGSTKGSQSSLQTSPALISPKTPNLYGNTGRRLSLNIGCTAPRRQSLTVDGLSSLRDAQIASSGNATGSLRNKVALKPGHSLMGWIRLASTAKNLSGTNGKIIEVGPDELAKHDKVEDCWVALKGNVYNVTTYLQYHPGGVEELMRGAGRDATELFNEVHRWVNYESILAKCLVGPYKLDSPLTPSGRANFATMTTTSGGAQQQQPATKNSSTTKRHDPTVAQKPNRRQSIALTVPSPNKYQSLLLNNTMNQIQQPPTYVIMQDKSCIKLKIQDLTTLPVIRSRHMICDLDEQSQELHISTILSPDWLYRVHLRLDQQIDSRLAADINNDDGTITIQLNKKEASMWNKIGTSMDLNDSLCEMTLADKFFRPCQLVKKQKLTHDTYLFEFSLTHHTLMYVPVGWHVLIREHSEELNKKQQQQRTDNSENNNYDDYRVHKNYTPVLESLLDNDGCNDETGFMKSLYFIIKLYPNGVVTSSLSQLNIGDRVDISDYQYVDFDIESHCMNSKHWILFAAGTGITPFCRTLSYLTSQNEDQVKSISLVFFNKSQQDIIWRDQFDNLAQKNDTKFKVTHVLSNEPEDGSWAGKRGKINKDLVADIVDSLNPDEIQMLACGPRAFTQLAKSICTELNLQEKLYIFHG